MKHLIYMILALFLFAGTAAVEAEEHKLTWVEPTSREDNTPLLRSEISHFDIYNSADMTDVINDIPANLNEIIHDFPFGTHNIVMTATDTDGRESVISPIVTIEAAASPKSVTNFQAERVPQ